MVLFMLVLSALFMILEWVCIGFGIWKGFLFVPREKKGRSSYFITECLALDVTAYRISSLKSDFYIYIQVHKKLPYHEGSFLRL